MMIGVLIILSIHHNNDDRCIDYPYYIYTIIMMIGVLIILAIHHNNDDRCIDYPYYTP